MVVLLITLQRRTQFKALCLDPSPKVALAANTLSFRRNAMLRLAARRTSHGRVDRAEK